MIRVHRRPLRLGAALLTAGLLAAGCGSPTSSANGQAAESTTTATIAKGPDTTAAQLRSKLNGLLVEYVYLGSALTSASLGKRPDEFVAADAAFRSNSDNMTENISAVFGASVGKTFDPLWKKHLQYFVDYTQGLASHDSARSAQAQTDLAQYAKDFGAFINSVLPTLPADTVAAVVATEVQRFEAVIDAQAAGNQNQVYTNERAAAANMAAFVSPLVGAIAKAQPDKIGGDPASKAADLVTTLTVGLRENAFLTCAATDAALGGRNDELTAARTALDNNSAALTDAFAGIYGPPAGTTFGPLWSKHIGFFVDYAMAVGAKQQTKADEAVGNLLQSSLDLGAFINTASPKISKDSAAGLFKTHVSTVKDVIDAQAAKDFTRAYTAERVAADQMSVIATTLAPLIVAQFPNKY
jgi:hypothetical protein